MSFDLHLNGLRAVVTGGTLGLGAAVVRTLAEAGARVATSARSAPAHERAIRTLLDWGLEVDEAMFLGGLEKSAFLQEFEPDFFFDDQTRHCDAAALVVPTGHVAAGVVND